MNCYYRILGISTRASEDEIKKSFRILALRWHPDRNPQDPRAVERFREALEAYETLIDPQKRCQYDTRKGYGNGGGSGRGNGRRNAGKEKVRHGGAYRDIVEEAFGIRVERSGNGRGVCDLRFDLQVSRSILREGAYEDIEYVRSVFCPKCRGKGRKSTTASCRNCSGVGEVEEVCSIRIWVPAGSREGTRLRIHGAGDCIYPGAPAGDLIILLYVMEGR